MIRKFDSQRDLFLTRHLKFTYESCLPYLDFAGYVLECHGRSAVAVQDAEYPNEFPYLSLPKNLSNLSRSHFLFVEDDELSKLKKAFEIKLVVPVGREFFYHTDDFVVPKGGDRARFRQQVSKFCRLFRYKIFRTYDQASVEKFCRHWLKQQNFRGSTFDESLLFFYFCLKHRQRYGIKTLFVEVDKRLVGVAMGVIYNRHRWVGLHLKVDYRYRGLSRFLHQERAKLFRNYPEFTLGTGTTDDQGIVEYKQSLKPHRTVEYFYVVTGNLL